MNFSRNNIGVALIEVLISVSILGVGMGTVFQGLSTGIRIQSRLEERALGRQLAEAKVSELRLGGPLSADQGGVFDAPFESYSWTAEVQQPAGDIPFVFVQVDILSGEEKQRVYSFETLLPAQ